MQVRIDFNIEDIEIEEVTNKIYNFLKQLNVENLIVSNEEENPELFL